MGRNRTGDFWIISCKDLIVYIARMEPYLRWETTSSGKGFAIFCTAFLSSLSLAILRLIFDGVIFASMVKTRERRRSHNHADGPHCGIMLNIDHVGVGASSPHFYTVFTVPRCNKRLSRLRTSTEVINKENFCTILIEWKSIYNKCQLINSKKRKHIILKEKWVPSRC